MQCFHEMPGFGSGNCAPDENLTGGQAAPPVAGGSSLVQLYTNVHFNAQLKSPIDLNMLMDLQ